MMSRRWSRGIHHRPHAWTSSFFFVRSHTWALTQVRLQLHLMSMLIIMSMMILRMMILKIAKDHFIWVFEVGTFRGHKPIIDQSCGAVFFPDSSHRDLSASNLPGLMQWICDPVMPEILANFKPPTSSFFLYTKIDKKKKNDKNC